MISDEAPVDCVRCKKRMARQVATPRAGGKAVRADVCAQCGAIWFDEEELSEIDAKLGALPFRRAELSRMAKASAACDACPRCHASGPGGPVEVPLLDVTVDFCPSCGGVWLDGGEYEALARASREASEKNTVSSYRSAPRLARTLATGRFSCARCNADTEIAQSCVRPSGLVCDACHLALADEEKAAPRDYGALRGAMLAGRLNPLTGGADGRPGVLEMLRGMLESSVVEVCPFCKETHAFTTCPYA